MRRADSRDIDHEEDEGLRPRHVAVTIDSDDSPAVARPSVAESGRRYLSLETNGILAVVWHRTSVLVSLLLLQSLSQFILEMYEGLIAKHVIIPLFLTMLVGAGGNAGNQATVRAITGLASGEFAQRDYMRLLAKESIVGVVNAALLAGIGFGRVYYFYGNHDMFYSTVAITLSLFLIVAISAVLGCTLPFLIGGLGFDREHAAPVIQVTMDIVGVFVTCAMCSMLIPDRESKGPAHTPAPR
jgi:Mg/Co/Ni transporter MgtE